MGVARADDQYVILGMYVFVLTIVQCEGELRQSAELSRRLSVKKACYLTPIDATTPIY